MAGTNGSQSDLVIDASSGGVIIEIKPAPGRAASHAPGLSTDENTSRPPAPLVVLYRRVARWWVFRGLFVRTGFLDLFREKGIRENLMASVLLAVIALLGALTFHLGETSAEKRHAAELDVEQRRVDAEREASARDRALRLSEARLALLHQQQAMCAEFANAIPQAILIVQEYKRREVELADLRAASPPFRPLIDELEERQSELDREWRDRVNYLAACRMIEVRFQPASQRVASLRCTLDILTELKSDDPAKALAEFKRVCGPAMEAEPHKSVLVMDAQEAEDVRGVQRRWLDSYNTALKSAEGWCGYYERLNGQAGAGAVEGSVSEWEARRNAFDAVRVMLKHAVDILYVESMDLIGGEIYRTQEGLNL